jgi:hypothetical protein
MNQSWKIPFEGFYYFVTNPKLWLKPLCSALVIVILMMIVFGVVFGWTYPPSSLPWLSYIAGISKSLGYGIFALLLFWVCFLPVIFGLFFESWVGLFLKKQGIKVSSEGFFSSFSSVIYYFLHTIGWRLFWPLASLFCTLFFGPIGFFIGQLGMGHIALIDGADLTLSLLGVDGKERVAFLKKQRINGLFFALGSAVLSSALSFTFIGWFFWLPGIILASTLFVLRLRDKNATTRVATSPR